MRVFAASPKQTAETNAAPGQTDTDPGFSSFDHMKSYGQAAVPLAIESINDGLIQGLERITALGSSAAKFVSEKFSPPESIDLGKPAKIIGSVAGTLAIIAPGVAAAKDKAHKAAGSKSGVVAKRAPASTDVFSTGLSANNGVLEPRSGSSNNTPQATGSNGPIDGVKIVGKVLPNVPRSEQDKLERHYKKTCSSFMAVAPLNNNHVRGTGSVEKTDQLTRKLIEDNNRQKLVWTHKAGRKLCALFIYRFDGTASVMTRENTPNLEGKTGGEWTDNYPLIVNNDGIKQSMQSAVAYMGPKSS